MTDKEIVAELIAKDWTFRYWQHPATRRWCHRPILCHDVLISPKGTLYHEACAITRYRNAHTVTIQTKNAMCHLKDKMARA